MDEISDNLFLGIVSGLTATFITFFIKNWWDKILVPWYEEKIYKDAKIEGRWTGDLQFENNTRDTFVIEIKRKGHSISGDLLNKKDGKKYILYGEFRNTIITMNYESCSPEEVDRGTYTLMLTKNGKELTGYCAYYYDRDYSVHSGKIVLKKEGSEKGEIEQ